MNESQGEPAPGPFDWETVKRSLARSYRVPPSMVVLFVLVPLYILIPAYFPPRVRHVPELAFDRTVPLVPWWAIVYGALYLWLILLPIVVVRQDELIRRAVHSYLLVWITAYAFFFLVYPTVAPRPDTVGGEGFAVWSLRALYSADPPYNCFPSLHVAHSFVSALACARVHRRLGALAVVAAALVAISTLFTRQHYVLDVLAGGLLAFVAYAMFLRPYAYDRIPDLDRRAAPTLALCVGAVAATALAGAWLVYLWGGETQFLFEP